ncbi:MAG: hypothetical protein KY459_13470 [Acidobacteria bacterium]|nr:hypothetical protein [Acidobacteriota bacterium]
MAKNGRGSVGKENLSDSTPLIEEGILTSVQVPDLLLFIEELRGRPVEIDELGPGAFQSIDVIMQRFFADV